MLTCGLATVLMGVPDSAMDVSLTHWAFMIAAHGHGGAIGIWRCGWSSVEATVYYGA